MYPLPHHDPEAEHLVLCFVHSICCLFKTHASSHCSITSQSRSWDPGRLDLYFHGPDLSPLKKKTHSMLSQSQARLCLFTRAFVNNLFAHFIGSLTCAFYKIIAAHTNSTSPVKSPESSADQRLAIGNSELLLPAQGLQH
jgi:hypothetical protein